jgi:hypothetical protein
MRAGGSASIKRVSGERLGVIRRRAAGAVHVWFRGEAGDGPVVIGSRRRWVQRGAVAIGVGGLCGWGFLWFEFGPLAFHCPVPCSSRRGREELGKTRASRASHGEKGCLLPLPTSSNHHLWCRRCWGPPCMGVDEIELPVLGVLRAMALSRDRALPTSGSRRWAAPSTGSG